MGKNMNFFKKVASLVLAGLTIFSSVTTSKAFEEKSTPNSIQIKNNKSVLQNIKALKTKNLSLSQKVGMGLGIGGLGILSVAGIYYAIDSFMNEPNEALPLVQQETSLNTFVENKTTQKTYIEIKPNKLGYNLLNIAIVGKDKDLSQEVINRLCKFAQKADGYDDIFLVRSRSGRHFGIKFYNIAESGLEAISECHYAFCPFNLVNPNLENTITELDNLKELIKSKNYLCDITFIPICNSSMSEEENRTCIETINQYAVSCEKEHRWDGIQDFNSVYLGKDEEKLIPALLENIAEWGDIRINDFRCKFGKNAIFI